MPEEPLAQVAKEAAALKRLVDLYAKAAAAAAEGHYLDAGQVLRRNGDLSRRLGRALRDAAKTLPEAGLENIVQEREALARRRLKSDFEAGLEQAGLSWFGEWPTYVIESVVRLTIDLLRGDATLDGKSLGTIEPTRVVPAAKQRSVELIDRAFDPDEFRRVLQEAYTTEASRRGTAFGAFVAVQPLYLRVRQRFMDMGADKQYSEAKFAVDLYRLRQADIIGSALHLSPAQDASGGLYVPSGSGGNYIAALRFVDGGNREHA